MPKLVRAFLLKYTIEYHSPLGLLGQHVTEEFTVTLPRTENGLDSRLADEAVREHARSKNLVVSDVKCSSNQEVFLVDLGGSNGQ